MTRRDITAAEDSSFAVLSTGSPKIAKSSAVLREKKEQERYEPRRSRRRPPRLGRRNYLYDDSKISSSRTILTSKMGIFFSLLVSCIHAFTFSTMSQKSFSSLPSPTAFPVKEQRKIHSNTVVSNRRRTIYERMCHAVFGTGMAMTKRLASSALVEAMGDDASVNCNCYNGDDILSRLFGSVEARDSFFANDFGKNVVHIRRSTSGNDIRDLNLPCIDVNEDSNYEKTSKINMKILFDTSEFIALRIRGSMTYLNKAETSYDDFCEYIGNRGSAVIPVAEENALMPFRNQIEASMRDQLHMRQRNSQEVLHQEQNEVQAGINVYHSGPGAVALNRHFDQYDVFVLHLDGHKDWEIGVFDPDHVIDDDAFMDTTSIDKVRRWTNMTLVPGDVLYIPKGVYHAATTADGYESTTHATIGLEY